ncbi:MAG: hypothetical protein AB7S69_18210 [Salinivirgaceae bacterium]
MKKIQKYSLQGLALMLASLVLISTSGLRIYSHTCSHKHLTNYSLLIPAPDCEDPGVVVEKTSCCTLPVENETTNCTSQASDMDCCSDHQQVVKLDTETLISQHKVEQKPLVFDLLPFLFALVEPQTLSASIVFPRLISPQPHQRPNYWR